MSKKLSPVMRKTLEALGAREDIIDAGATAGEVEASGGSRAALRNAIRKGWVNVYSQRQGFYGDRKGERRAPRYYRTDEGTEMLETTKRFDRRTSKAIRDAFYAGWAAASRYNFPEDHSERRRRNYEKWCEQAQIEPYEDNPEGFSK